MPADGTPPSWASDDHPGRGRAVPGEVAISSGRALAPRGRARVFRLGTDHPERARACRGARRHLREVPITSGRAPAPRAGHGCPEAGTGVPGQAPVTRSQAPIRPKPGTDPAEPGTDRLGRTPTSPDGYPSARGWAPIGRSRTRSPEPGVDHPWAGTVARRSGRDPAPIARAPTPIAPAPAPISPAPVPIVPA
jgi:hypothetical protein